MTRLGRPWWPQLATIVDTAKPHAHPTVDLDNLHQQLTPPDQPETHPTARAAAAEPNPEEPTPERDTPTPADADAFSKIHQAADALSKARHAIEHAPPDTPQPTPEQRQFDQPEPSSEAGR
ncbi:hypothetical protein [Dactylosporangium sp. NPDC005555]|uniref:hypothetical protein n=1 Tax=Dactylosporangium sp. NPDC005555 TaxID=3154889 RepID=UPI0033A12C82